MKADIWMPLYIGDYLADTARLTTEQHGAYLLLLMDYWRSGKLPDNDQVLAQISKLSPDAWSNAKAMLMQYFSIEQGYWVHKRVEQELVDAAQNKDKKHQRAVKAADARWKKERNDASSNAQALHKECPSPSPSPSPVLNTIVGALAPRATRFNLDLLPLEWEQFCLEKRSDLNPREVFDQFRDYWFGVAGSKGTKLDWFATWRNWVRNQKQSIAPKADKMRSFWDQVNGETTPLIGGQNDL